MTLDSSSPNVPPAGWAPHEALSRVREAAVLLGLPPKDAERAARNGRLVVNSRQVELGLSADGRAFIVTTAIGARLLGTQARRRAALECSLPLAILAGMSIGHDLETPVLTQRVALESLGADELAASIADAVVVASILSAQGIAPVRETLARIREGAES